MHLVTFEHGGRRRIGVLGVARSEIVDVSAVDRRLPQGLLELIASGGEGLGSVRAASASTHHRIALAEVRLLAPIPVPARNLLCVGKNYRDHVRELRGALTPAGAATGCRSNRSSSPRPRRAWWGRSSRSRPIWTRRPPPNEGELAVVIGRGGRGIARDDAMQHVFGYTIVNDVTSRGLQRRHQQWFLGKSVDGFCPMGPAIVTADVVPDVTTLRVCTRVNGELRQEGVIADLIFDIPDLIATISRTMTLQPGDLIATGTPAGVGMGFDPPRFLRAGDRVAITIEPIGTLENPVE